jgi:hypothetical protein
LVASKETSILPNQILITASALSINKANIVPTVTVPKAIAAKADITIGFNVIFSF